MSEFTAFLWDVDGTLIDTTQLIIEALEYTYQTQYGRSMPHDERRALIGIPLKKQIRVFGEPEEFGKSEQEVIAACIGFYESHKSLERILDSVTSILIQGKKKGYPTALVTSKNREEFTNTIPRLEISDYIDAAVTADDVIHPKPSPEGILQALELLKIAPDRKSQAVYIGDTTHDMKAARLAGVQGIAVTWGAGTHAQLELEKPVYICHTPQELSDLLLHRSGSHSKSIS